MCVCVCVWKDISLCLNYYIKGFLPAPRLYIKHAFKNHSSSIVRQGMPDFNDHRHHPYAG